MKTMTLQLDDLDYDTLQKEIAERQVLDHCFDGSMLPDGKSDIAGAHLAEAIRDLNDYRAIWEKEHPPIVQ